MQRKRIFSGNKVCPQPPKGLKLKYKEQGNFEAIFAVLESQNCVNGNGEKSDIFEVQSRIEQGT